MNVGSLINPPLEISNATINLKNERNFLINVIDHAFLCKKIVILQNIKLN